MKKLNKTVLLAAVLASAANAGVIVGGDATIGLEYLAKSHASPTHEKMFVVDGGNSEHGFGHLTFAATDGGKGGNGAYAFVETFFDLADSTSLSTGQTYAGYNAKKFDVRLGKLDSLTYQWVGSLNEQQLYADNIAIIPVSNENVNDSIQFTTKLGSVTLGAGAVLDESTTYDYTTYDLGAKFEVGKLGFSIVHQEANDGISTTGYLHRNTTSGSLEYAFKNLTSNRFLKDLEAFVTYADYSEQTAAVSSRQSEDSAYSVGLKLNNNQLLYQTGIRDSQEMMNFQHTRPISKNTNVGIMAQFDTSDYYDFNAAGVQAAAINRDDEYLGVFISTPF
ncbi:MAG: hypothetical protein VX835_02080 [Pseudomonadota bacterium]|nr:hypothetical protein [Pseudomonadota bacterium]